MPTIVIVAVIGILLFHASGAIPASGVGGAMVAGFALLAAVPAVGIHEAWTRRRGPLGWVVSIAVAFVGANLVAPLGGFAMVVILSPFMDKPSMAASGEGVMAVGLAGSMVFMLLGAWAALRFVGRWR